MRFPRPYWSRDLAFLFLLAVFFLNPTIGNDVEAIYEQERTNCYKNSNSYLKNGTRLIKCNVSFVGACWPETLAGSTFIQPCPTLFFSAGGFIHRRCNTSGHWERMNFSQCRKLEESQALRNGKQLTCNLTNTTVSLVSAADNGRRACQSGDSASRQPTLFPGLIPPAPKPREKPWERVPAVQQPLDSGTEGALPQSKSRVRGIQLDFCVNHAALVVHSNCLHEAHWPKQSILTAQALTGGFLDENIYVFHRLLRRYDSERFFAGFPALLTFIIYVPVSLAVYGDQDPRCWSVHGQEPLMMILYGPMTCMLVINLGITTFALYVLVRKMKATSTPDLQIARKATKGALILIPQMGVIYLAIFYTPRGNTAFDYFVRVVFPLQGALAALVFVAWNSEVRQAVIERWHQWCYQHNFTTRRSGSGSGPVEQAPGIMATRAGASFASSLTRTTTLNPEEIPGTPLSLQFGIQSPIPGLARVHPEWTEPRMIEMREIRRQSPPSQTKTTKVILHPQPGCSHQTPVTTLSSPVASPKCTIPSSSAEQKSLKAPTRPELPRRGSLPDYFKTNIRCQPMEAQQQPRRKESRQSYDSGIDGMQAENRLSSKIQIFEEEIYLEDSLPVRPAPSRVLDVKRKSCPAVGQSLRMTESLPLNIYEAFKGYGVWDKPKPLKKPRKHNRSKSLFSDLDSEVERPHLSHRRMAWTTEDVNITKSKKDNQSRK
ncbi:hypothetical protein ACROYT_G026621 [Oculina patagonica]